MDHEHLRPSLGPSTASTSQSIPSAEPLAKPRSFEGWLNLFVSFSILTVAFSLALFSLPVFYPALARTFHWNHASVAAGGSIVLLLIGGVAPLVGWLVDRYSPKAVLIGGMCIVATALALLSVTSSLVQYLAFCFLLGLGISSVSILPNSILIAPWFAKRGLAVGVINAGIGLGGFVAPMATSALIARRGVSHAFLTLSASIVAPLLLTIFLVRNKARRKPGEASNRGESLPLGADAGPAGAKSRRTALWIFGFSLFFGAHAMLAIQQHLVLYLTGQGITAKQAALSLSVALGASALGKILSGAIADAYSARLALILSILFVGMGIAALLAFGAGAGLIYMIVFGLGYGGIFNAPPLIVFELFGTAKVGKMLGLLLLFFGAGTSTGGLLAGYIFDRTHQYASAFAIDLAAATAGLVLAFFAKGRVRARMAA